MNSSYESVLQALAGIQHAPEITWSKRWEPTAAAYRWYWRLKAGNYKIVAIGGEGFNSYDDMVTSIRNVGQLLPLALSKPFKEEQ
jgi:hypothetical protein